MRHSGAARSSARRCTVAIVVAVLCVEAVLQLVVALREESDTPPTPQYVPYVGYVHSDGRAPNAGMPPGFRDTYWPVDEGPVVWMLGGSTMYGDGQRNSGVPCQEGSPCTLPSWLAQTLHGRGSPHRVWNLGQRGYGISQERILFDELLSRHEPPAVAVFYDGANERLEEGSLAGYPLHYGMFRDRLEWSDRRPGLESGLARARFKLPYLLHFLFNNQTIEPPVPFFGSLPSGHPDAAEDLAQNYVHNTRLLAATCEKFGVRCLFLWQPVAFDHPPTMARVGEQLASIVATPEWQEARSSIRARLSATPSFHDLSDALQRQPEPLFEDECHIDERTPGHKVLAEVIANLLLGEER